MTARLIRISGRISAEELRAISARQNAESAKSHERARTQALLLRAALLRHQ
jgi:hypothetical protein